MNFAVRQRHRLCEDLVFGTISLNYLLSARVLNIEAETRREKVLQMPKASGQMPGETALGN